MPQRPSSSSKTTVIVGVLAGLLGAGIGAYYPRRPAPADAPTQAQRAASAPKAGAVAGRSKEQASKALMALPELQAWSAFIEKNSGGAAHGALIEYDLTPRLINGKRYWQLSFVENSAEAAHRWESFLVASGSDEILVEDPASDEPLSLERWRREKQPMRRRGGVAAPL
ncbi:hypothetical protein ACFDR9_001764 [Janthinobacterium sp. CG_23.3]|uniref:hypothetical protein n=1 Tax=unclassified Janthinobacterium TaxID=2610881 RepID=UPI0003474572|nr:MULTISPECIES: hypothetical protein [unclassified Janthinobacterium]MEC5162719.1 hypothetical protein [Janthinobacterium sp. CG_S6]